MDASLFYTGIVAELYGALRSAGAPDPAPYARFIERSGQPALELGCGEGEPLLDLRALGLDVEGLDSSPDMLDRCRAAAARRGLDVVVHLQSIESMQLDRRFRAIFLAGPTFNLLPDDDVAAEALRRIRLHLAPGGSALVPLFVPEPTPPHLLGRPRTHVGGDDAEMRLTPVSEVRDESRRCQTTVLRYELTTVAGTLVEERPWQLHWYTQDDFRSLAEAAGLEIVRMLGPGGGSASQDDSSFVVILRERQPTA